MVTRLPLAVNTSSKPESGRYAAAKALEGKLAIPIQPTEASCQASSCQTSISSVKAGSMPPAAGGFMNCIRPLFHRASTVAAGRVRRRSVSAAWARTVSRIERAISRGRGASPERAAEIVISDPPALTRRHASPDNS